MDEQELEAVRAKRMAELQTSTGGGGGGGGGRGAADEQKEQQKQKAADEEARNSILSQVLEQSARARLNTIAAAKPDKAKMLENTIINMARFGQIGGKLNDEQLRQLLDKISERTQKSTTVKFDRRRAGLDSDDDGDV